MNDWRIFHGDNVQRGSLQLPPPPPWRRFPTPRDGWGATFRASPPEIRMVNAALYLRRPLLVTGPPGSGKSSLASAVALELGLGQVLRWPINSRSTLAEGLYRYDAVARLRDASLRSRDGASEDADGILDIGNYLTLGPLGTALLPRDRPRVLVIDEIDKSDIDLPNDLLHVFEEGRFEIPELVRAAPKQKCVKVLPSDGRPEHPEDRVAIEKGAVDTREFPFIVITSNGERELPPAFLRRCLRLEMPPMDAKRLREIVEAHLGVVNQTSVDALIQQFLAKREEGHHLAIDQLLNAVSMVTAGRAPEGDDWIEVRAALLRPLDEQ